MGSWSFLISGLMKRIVPLLVFLLAGAPMLVARADALAEAAALAAERNADERYKRLNADIQNIQDTQELLIRRQEEFRQRLDRLADEIRALKDDQTRSSGNYATREELRSYVAKLKEVDDKREADKKLILEGIRDLAKVPVVVAAPVQSRPQSVAAAESSDEAPFIYVVKRNDRLLDIIAEYNAYFEKHGQSKITMGQVLKANPGLKPDRLFPGKKLRIPVPSKDGN